MRSHLGAVSGIGFHLRNLSVEMWLTFVTIPRRTPRALSNWVRIFGECSKRAVRSYRRTQTCVPLLDKAQFHVRGS